MSDDYDATTAAIASLFFRAQITYADITREGDGWRVRVPRKRGGAGRAKRLYAEMLTGNASVLQQGRTATALNITG